MREIHVTLETCSYSILVGSGLVDQLGEYLPVKGKIALVTTSVINKLYGLKVAKAIREHDLILVPDGEEAKKWKVVEELIGTLMQYELDRKSTIVALGGGSIGDLAGFVASIYMRGIRIIQIPTTLLAMVDSSIGGKTAINHPKGKNLVGSFYQPFKVIIDPLFLETLPKREFCSGMAEVIKYGLIADAELYNLLEGKNPNNITNNDMIKIIARCAATKAIYVERDEEDRKGIRAALNLGHTLGHAIETLSKHSINHGEGVSIGMVAASWISKENGLITDITYHNILGLLEKYGLPTRVPNLNKTRILEVMHRDKKAEAGQIRFVLPTGIGKNPILRYVSNETILRVLEELS
ncbi:3-dehydroquinate synthase [Thermoproteota archaeon]